MLRSTRSKRLAILAVVAGAMTVLVPLAQAGSDPSRVADSIDTARIVQQRTELQSSLQSGYGVQRVADAIDTARAAQPRPTSSWALFRMLESQAAPLVQRSLERAQPTSGGRSSDAVVQAGYDHHRVADSVDTAQAAMQRERELSYQPGYDVQRVADSVETARGAQQRPTSSWGLFRMLDSQAAPLVERPQPTIDTRRGGFDWADFGLGAGAGIGLMLLLGGLGVGVTRFGRGQIRTA